MKYLGIDFAWSKNNYSALSLLDEENLFEIYTHATIIRCFTKDQVLPYKRKKGKNNTI